MSRALGRKMTNENKEKNALHEVKLEFDIVFVYQWDRKVHIFGEDLGKLLFGDTS